MVIELSGVQFGLKSYEWSILKSDKCEFNLNYKYAWFQTNIVWHKAQLQLITAILKSQNSVSTNTIKFWPSSQFLEKWKEKGF